MSAAIRVVHMRTKVPEQGQPGVQVINTCNNNPKTWNSDLSPFLLGPCKLFNNHQAQIMENGWQYCKVYKQHIGNDGNPNQSWWNWAQSGWNSKSPNRYPMGKGAKPEYSYWNGQKLGYIDSRKTIYAPIYINAVRSTNGFAKLQQLYENSNLLVLRDHDGWDFTKQNMTLTDVLNFPNRIMGHSCVLAMLLQNDPALNQLIGI